MSHHPIDIAFGQLRSLMQQQTLDKEGRAYLLYLMSWAYENSREVYLERWLPYLHGFPHHFTRPLITLSVIGDLRYVAPMMPFPCITYAVSRINYSGFALPKTEMIYEMTVRSSYMSVVQSVHGIHKDIGDAFACALAQSHYATSVTSIELLHTSVSQAGLQALQRSPHLSSLGRLRIAQESVWRTLEREEAPPTGLDDEDTLVDYELLGEGLDEGLQIMTAPLLSPHHDSRVYSFKGQHLSAEDMRALMNSPRLDNVEDLNLTQNAIADEGVRALAQSHRPTSFKSLKLEHNAITTDGALALASSPHLGALKILRLCDDISFKGMLALIESTCLRSLRALSVQTKARTTHQLDTTRLHTSAECFETLAHCTLNTSKGAVFGEAWLSPQKGYSSAYVFGPATSFWTGHIQWVYFSRQYLDAWLNQSGRSVDQASALLCLDLSRCDLQDEHVLGLLQSDHLSSLEVLDLSHNRIGDVGAQALANSPHLSHLTHLYLSQNQISRMGAMCIARSPYLRGALRIEIHSNQMTHEDEFDLSRLHDAIAFYDPDNFNSLEEIS